MGVGKHAVGAVAHVVAEGTIARRGNHDAAVLEAGDIGHARFHRAREAIVAEAVRRGVVVVQAVIRAHPEVAALVAQQRHHGVAHERRAIGIVVQKGREAVAVEAVQTVVGGYPDVTIVVLAHVAKQAAREQT